ncbi:MAG: hypothetical protein OEY09_01300 [Gammaproteobacteria bacterium]|nr:hypothetical protein [Gammaproteobacteria bacterium]
MLNLKTGIKVSLLSALILAGSIATTARADHEGQSILPYLAAGVIASVLLNNTQTYRYEKKRYYGYNNHGSYHRSYRKQRKHSHSHSGYQYNTQRNYRH